MAAAPAAGLKPASHIGFPGGQFPEINLTVTDCNSPCWWSSGTLYMLNSAADPWRSSGPDVAHLGPSARVSYTTPTDGYRWIESVHQLDDGTLYGWYHNEAGSAVPDSVNAGRERGLTAPRIGGARSRDNGATWDDLGTVIVAPRGQLDLATKNYYFAGGTGDFSVILDRKGEYFYFVYSSYARDPALQGVCMARLKYADRDKPNAKATLWRDGAWSEPAIMGLPTPFLPSASSWHGANPDAFWGPSIHWNTYLNCYVILLNRAVDPKWTQEGIYVAFNQDLTNPAGWTKPVRIREGGGWYPQVVGMDKGAGETDRLAGRSARFFMSGNSDNEIVFSNPYAPTALRRRAGTAVSSAPRATVRDVRASLRPTCSDGRSVFDFRGRMQARTKSRPGR